MSMAKLVFGLVALSLFVSCSTFDRRSQKRSGPAVRDIPFKARSTAEPRKRILVLPFVPNEKHSEKVGKVARFALIRRLLKTDRFVIVRNADFPQDVNSFLVNGQYQMEKIANIAKGLGIVAVIEGKVLDIRVRRIGDEVGILRSVKAKVQSNVRLRIFGSGNGREVLNEVRTAKVDASTRRFGKHRYTDRDLQDDPVLIEQCVKKAFHGLAPTIVRTVRKLSWEGRIALVSGERLYVNAGRMSGIQIGDILKVLDPGEDVFDPDTGDLIGEAPGRMKGTIEIVSYFGKDGSVAVIHSGAGFKENDPVELY
jgi:hypothetical protein